MMHREFRLDGAMIASLGILLIALASPPLAAQQKDQTNASPSPQTQTEAPPSPSTVPPTPKPSPRESDTAESAEKSKQSKKPENDRLFFALPNYSTVEKASRLPPLTVKQKFKLVAYGNFDPVEYFTTAAVAGIGQATNSDPTFGQGFKGYAKRYGTQFADNTVENFMVGGVFPSLFHQDPRYYQMGKGRFLKRFEYAAMHDFITRSDAGKPQFNFSEVLGAGTAATISDTYHPAPRGVGTVVGVWGTQLGLDAISNEVKEFWPDIHRRLRHQH